MAFNHSEASNKRYHRNIMQAPVATCILRGKKLVVEIANERMLAIWNKPSEAVLNKPIFEALSEAKGQGFEEIIEQVYKTGIPFIANEMVLNLPFADGVKTSYLNFIYEPVKEFDGTVSGIVATASDVTVQVIARKEIEDSEHKFRLLANALPQLIWSTDSFGIFNYYNDSLLLFSGVSAETLKEQNWIYFLHPDDRDKNVAVWQEALLSGKGFSIEHRLRRYDGQYRWHFTEVLTKDDAVINAQIWIGTSTDIEVQKTFAEQLEKQIKDRTGELELKNRQLEKMNGELKSFAYVASHDLQEPLRKIQTFASLIKKNEMAGLSTSGKNYFDRMHQSAIQMRTLISDLLAYSKASIIENNFELTDLHKIMEEVKNELKESIQKKEATIEISQLEKAFVIPYQFRQLLNNLISNALKFSRPGVPSRIKIRGRLANAAAPEDKHYHLIISDNGIGFEPEYKERIFEVFQRLHGKTEYEGTGIGLAIVKRIVENHNGQIDATGVLHVGVTFNIYFPQP